TATISTCGLLRGFADWPAVPAGSARTRRATAAAPARALGLRVAVIVRSVGHPQSWLRRAWKIAARASRSLAFGRDDDGGRKRGALARPPSSLLLLRAGLAAGLDVHRRRGHAVLDRDLGTDLQVAGDLRGSVAGDLPAVVPLLD